MRTTLISKPRTVRTAVAAFAALSTVGLSACGGDTAGTETGADVEDIAEDDAAADLPEEDATAGATEDTTGDDALAGPYDGVYDTAFYEDLDTYVGEQVTLSADVNEVITEQAFTIAGTDDTSVEALLVVGATDATELSPETTVGVTGTVMESFTVAGAEEELGVDLDDALFAEWEQEPYVVAETVEVLEDAAG